MAVEMWKAGEDVMSMMQGLIGSYHPHLAMVDGEIAVLFREKASKAGGQVILGKSKKAPAIIGILGDIEYKFIIEIAADEWSGMDSSQQTALLDHHLCACRIDENPTTGTMSCFIAPPDVIAYRGEIERHGMWRNSDDPIEAVSEAPIQQMFGTDTTEASA